VAGMAIRMVFVPFTKLLVGRPLLPAVFLTAVFLNALLLPAVFLTAVFTGTLFHLTFSYGGIISQSLFLFLRIASMLSFLINSDNTDYNRRYLLSALSYL